MNPRSVHWHEGMFLRPHHFQAAQRHWFHRAHLDEKWDHHYGSRPPRRPHPSQAAQRPGSRRPHPDEKWDHHYGWGRPSVEIAPAALANKRFVVRSLRARLRDGTLVRASGSISTLRRPQPKWWSHFSSR